MKHNESSFASIDDTELFYQQWLPEGEIKATIALIHGFGEHSGRYGNVVDYLAPKDYAIHSFDHRGHGRSPGQRGHINDFSEFRGDVQAFLRVVAPQHPQKPLFLYGHSMGGLITLDYALHYSHGLRGVIASAPAVGVVGVPPVVRLAARILSRLWPSFSLDAGLDTEGISRDITVVEAYENDPLVHGNASARLGAEIEKTADWVQAHAADWQLPLLIFHGTADRLTSPAASRGFYDNVTYADKRYVSYEGGYHESHNDIHKKQVLADIEGWLEDHL